MSSNVTFSTKPSLNPTRTPSLQPIYCKIFVHTSVEQLTFYILIYLRISPTVGCFTFACIPGHRVSINARWINNNSNNDTKTLSHCTLLTHVQFVMTKISKQRFLTVTLLHTICLYTHRYRYVYFKNSHRFVNQPPQYWDQLLVLNQKANCWVPLRVPNPEQYKQDLIKLSNSWAAFYLSIRPFGLYDS